MAISAPNTTNTAQLFQATMKRRFPNRPFNDVARLMLASFRQQNTRGGGFLLPARGCPCVTWLDIPPQAWLSPDTVLWITSSGTSLAPEKRMAGNHTVTDTLLRTPSQCAPSVEPVHVRRYTRFAG